MLLRNSIVFSEIPVFTNANSVEHFSFNSESVEVSTLRTGGVGAVGDGLSNA